jgi:hypothetical protein
LTKSLYERFYPLTSTGNQRFVANFQGDSFNTNIFNFRNVIGSSGTVTVTDEIDGGLAITTDSTTGSVMQIDMNDRRAFDPRASKFIFVTKRVGTSLQVLFGLTGDITSSLPNAISVANDTSLTYYSCRVIASNTGGFTNSDVAIDTDWHVHKGVCGTSDYNQYLDGILKITVTSNIPTVKCQPHVTNYARSSGGQESRIRYCEVYNT